MNSHPLAVFARLSSRPIPRVARMMQIARQMGMRTLFFSARREPGLSAIDRWDDLEIERLGPEFPLLNGSHPLTYLTSVLLYNVALFRALQAKQPTVIHASDIETMPASATYRLTAGARLIYNIHDNLSQRYRMPAFARAILNVVEGLFVCASDVTLVPEAFRRDALPAWARSRIEIVRNTPVDLGRAAIPPVEGVIRIFFGGWLDWGRGLSQILDLVERNTDFELVVAGEGSPDVIARVRSNPRTRFLGFVGHETVMRESAAAHIISALYDPERLINRYAASNKLAEALSLGRPVLINTEMKIAEDLAPYDCTISIEYARIAEVADRLRAAVLDKGRFSSLSDHARKAYEALYDWDVAQNAMRNALGASTPIGMAAPTADDAFEGM